MISLRFVVSAEFSLMSSDARIYNWIVKTEKREKESFVIDEQRIQGVLLIK